MTREDLNKQLLVGKTASSSYLNRFTFPKAEKLKSRISISTLFRKGESVSSAYTLIRYRQLPAQAPCPPAQASVSVSKKKFKFAHQRNRIKRLMREAYRLEKGPLLQHFHDRNQRIELMIVYISKHEASLIELREAIRKCIHEIIAS